MDTIKVATFYNAHPDSERAPVESRVNAYSRWFNPTWEGCIVYEVPRNGWKKAAMRLRFLHELRMHSERAEREFLETMERTSAKGDA